MKSLRWWKLSYGLLRSLGNGRIQSVYKTLRGCPIMLSPKYWHRPKNWRDPKVMQNMDRDSAVQWL